MPSIYTIKKPLLAEVCGLSEDGHDAIQPAISTLNVRLEQMWRELLPQYGTMFSLEASELDKLNELIKVTPKMYKRLRYRQAVLLQTPMIEFKPKDGITDHALDFVNAGPRNLAMAVASQCGVKNAIAFVRSPQLHYEQQRGKISLHLWLNAIYASHSKDGTDVESNDAG